MGDEFEHPDYALLIGQGNAVEASSAENAPGDDEAQEEATAADEGEASDGEEEQSSGIFGRKKAKKSRK